jgi:acyl-CoA thioesterase-1
VTATPARRRPRRYVALGDSYTIGTAVAEQERWPNQLVERLAREAAASGRPAALELVANPAVNGFTSRDVIAVELPGLAALRPEVVSLLVGTNDVIQGIDEDDYREGLAVILDRVAACGNPIVFGVTSPDYTVTPAGADYGDPATRADGIRRRNAIFGDVLGGRAIPVVDILEVSLAARGDRALVAADGLHPSGRQYARWVELILPVVRRLLAGRGGGASARAPEPEPGRPPEPATGDRGLRTTGS